MTPTLIREKPMKPATPDRARSPRSEPIVTRAELAECTCPEHCERDHGDE
jgi:hypothetical protein